MFNSIEELFENYNQTLNELEDGHPVKGPIQYHITGEGGGDWYLLINGNDVTAHQGVVEDPVTVLSCPASDYLNLKNCKVKHSTLINTKKLVISKGTVNILHLSDYMIKSRGNA